MEKTKMPLTMALGEVKIIDTRIQHANTEMQEYIARGSNTIDPLEGRFPGGSAGYVASKLQSIRDLNDRKIALRAAIRRANETTKLTICGVEKTIADWLVWKREVHPVIVSVLKNTVGIAGATRKAIANAAARPSQQSQVIGVAVQLEPLKPIVNVDEVALMAEIGKMEEIFGQLDTQLSIINATTLVEF